MLTAELGAPNQRGRRGHFATLAAVVVLSLAACVDQSNVIGTASVASTTMTPYEFTFTAAAMTSGFGVTVSSGGGLHVQSVTIGCPTM
jgi:hypothetical protein